MMEQRKYGSFPGIRMNEADETIARQVGSSLGLVVSSRFEESDSAKTGENGHLVFIDGINDYEGALMFWGRFNRQSKRFVVPRASPVENKNK